MIDYSNLYSCTIVPSPNSSYLYNTHTPTIQDPLGSSTMGLMMILSTFQYQAPTMNQNYSTALNSASKAAFIQSGGQNMENKVIYRTTSMFTDTAHSIGITDPEMIAVFGTAKVIRSRQMNINGPKIYSISTHISVNQNSGNLSFKYEW
jgi:hypothetical protein